MAGIIIGLLFLGVLVTVGGIIFYAKNCYEKQEEFEAPKPIKEPNTGIDNTSDVKYNIGTIYSPKLGEIKFKTIDPVKDTNDITVGHSIGQLYKGDIPVDWNDQPVGAVEFFENRLQDPESIRNDIRKSIQISQMNDQMNERNKPFENYKIDHTNDDIKKRGQIIIESHRILEYDVRMLRQRARDVDWKEVSRQPLHYRFIEKFPDKLDWSILSCHQTAKDLLKNDKFLKLINWRLFCKHQCLSEQTMNEYKDYIDWDMITLYQVLSEQFIIENMFKIKLQLLKDNQYFELVRYSEEFQNFYNDVIIMHDL